MTAWKPADGDERPISWRSCWMAMPGGGIAIGYWEGQQGPQGWRYVNDQAIVDPPPTHWAEIDVPVHPEVP